MRTAILAALVLSLGGCDSTDEGACFTPVAYSTAGDIPECDSATSEAIWDLGQTSAAPDANRIELYVCQWGCVPYACEANRVVTVRFLNFGDGTWSEIGVLVAPCPEMSYHSIE